MQSTTDTGDDDNDDDNDDGDGCDGGDGGDDGGYYDYGAPQNCLVTMHQMLVACCGMWHIINTMRYIGGKNRFLFALLQKSMISL